MQKKLGLQKKAAFTAAFFISTNFQLIQGFSIIFIHLCCLYRHIR